MPRNKDPFLHSLSRTLTNEQCCQAIAMRDVYGEAYAINHFGITQFVIRSLNKRVKTRPDLDQIYWDYRRSYAKTWIGKVGEAIGSCAAKVTQEINRDEPNLLLIRETVRAAEVFGGLAVSAMAIAPDIIEEGERLPRYAQIEPDMDDREPLLLSGSADVS